MFLVPRARKSRPPLVPPFSSKLKVTIKIGGGHLYFKSSFLRVKLSILLPVSRPRLVMDMTSMQCQSVLLKKKLPLGHMQ